MPPYYDIYGLSRNRDKVTIERFLGHYCDRQKVENREGQEILIYQNDKYNVPEINLSIKTLTEVIDYGIKNLNYGFAFYIGDNLKPEINHVILKFTFDGKIIFGISVEEKTIELIDNYPLASKIEKDIARLTESYKTSIEFEYTPSDDEEEFDKDIELWSNMNNEKQSK